MKQLIWMDIPVVSLSRAIKFYEAVLAAPLNPYDLAGEKMALLPQEPGAVSGCLVPASAGFQPSTQGVQERVKVLAKSSMDLQVGVDLEEPANVLFCDNFADGLFGFRPLQSITDARKSLLQPGAVVCPRRPRLSWPWPIGAVIGAAIKWTRAVVLT